MGTRKHPIPDVGQTFGSWTVIDNTLQPDPAKTKVRGILVKCTCGTEKIQPPALLYNGKSLQCLTCRGKSMSEKKFQGIGELSGTYFSQIKSNAKQRNLKFDLTKEYLWSLFNEQHGKCAISGIDLVMSKEYANVFRKTKWYESASLDRIDSSKGYIPGNVQWVHKDVNKIKQDLDQATFIKLCELITKKNKTTLNTRIIVRFHVEGLHCWENCEIEEVMYLKNLHRHQFFVIATKSVYHNDREIEFIKLSHQMKKYLQTKYFSKQHQCLLFGSQSCEMLATELLKQFKLDTCEVNEDGEGGAVVEY